MTTLHSLKIGIDFGTTYSGVAWAHTATPRKINVIQTWPARGNRTSDKVPTEISYLPSGGHKWGFEIPLEAEKLVWFKLLLESSVYTSTTANATNSSIAQTRKLTPPSKSIVDVIADYLGSLKQHTMNTLARNFDKEFLDVTPVDWILTVPAVWGDVAKALMMRAAVEGLGEKASIQLISEPDAAAVCTLKDLQPNHLKVDDVFIVADCGGGTVDLISYQIMALHPNPEIKECAVGTGGMCGSTYINKNFENFVRSRVGPEFSNIKPRGRAVMLKYFNEFLKPAFSDDEDEDIFSCPIPGIANNPATSVESGFFILTREDMRDIFEPIIMKIVNLVQGQIDVVEARQRGGSSGGQQTLDVSAILLVGGLGASEYLRQRLLSDLRIKGGAPIHIMQPTNAWSAVVRGAVLRGLEGGIVHSRMARRNYGISYSSDYDPKRHLKSERVYSQFDGHPEVLNCGSWYIQRGDVVSENQPISCGFVCRVWPEWDGIITVKLLASDLTVAPEKTDTADSYPMCKLTSDMTKISRDIFPRKVSLTGREYYEIFCDLVMTVQSAVLVFEFQFKKKTYGAVIAKYY